MSHSQHERLCKENKNRPEIVSNFKFKKTNPSLKTCRFCNKEYHVNKLPKHEIWCEENPNLEYVKEFYASGKKNPNQYI